MRVKRKEVVVVVEGWWEEMLSLEGHINFCSKQKFLEED